MPGNVLARVRRANKLDSPKKGDKKGCPNKH